MLKAPEKIQAKIDLLLYIIEKQKKLSNYRYVS